MCSQPHILCVVRSGSAFDAEADALADMFGEGPLDGTVKIGEPRSLATVPESEPAGEGLPGGRERSVLEANPPILRKPSVSSLATLNSALLCCSSLSAV